MSDEFDGLIILAEDMFYVRESGTGDMIPVPWDRLAGGELEFTELMGCGNLWIRRPDQEGHDSLILMWGPKKSYEDFVRRLARKGWLPGMSYAWEGFSGPDDFLCLRIVRPGYPDPGQERSAFNLKRLKRICDMRLDEVPTAENPLVVELVQRAEIRREDAKWKGK